MKKSMLMVATAVACAAASAVEFKAGFARTDITPPMGSFMPGYF